MKTTNALGIKVDNITYRNPGNSLPRFVREAAQERGYGDAVEPLSLFVQADDVEEAFACAAQGNGSACVMAQAGKRIGAKSAYFYRKTAWIDFGEGPIVRFRTGEAIYDNVIAPFDDGDREHVKTGIYHLTPPHPSEKLNKKRAYNQANRRKPPTEGRSVRPKQVQAHTERVVMAAYVN